MFFKRPYQSDQELERTCLDIATYLLKEVWEKLKNKKGVWKIKRLCPTTVLIFLNLVQIYVDKVGNMWYACFVEQPRR